MNSQNYKFTFCESDKSIIDALPNQEKINLAKQLKVEDELIGELEYSSELLKWVFNYREDYATVFEKPKNGLNLAIILESPHKYEFIDVNLSEGKGGKIKSRPLNNCETKKGLKVMLNECFTDTFNKKLGEFKGQKINIVVINAIQFQCSLGLNPEHFRDEMFLKLWGECQQGLISRLNELNSICIINCCTVGKVSVDKLKTWKFECCENGFEAPVINMNVKLKDIIEVAIKNIIKDKYYFRFNHPGQYCYEDQKVKFHNSKPSDKNQVKNIEIIKINYVEKK